MLHCDSHTYVEVVAHGGVVYGGCGGGTGGAGVILHVLKQLLHRWGKQAIQRELTQT